jgi:hypothetical protein
MSAVSDQPIPFTLVAEKFSVTVPTVLRWHTAGVHTPTRRIRLHAFKVGGLWRTTWEAVDQFISALNTSPSGPPPLTSAKQRRAREATERRLDSLRV